MSKTNHHKGGFFQIISDKSQILKLIRLFILIVPYNFLISVLFMFLNFMPISFDLEQAVSKILFAFFTGNLICAFFSDYIINYFKDYRSYLWINIILFILIIPLFKFVSNDFLFIYGIGLGLLGGGLPVIWIQIVNKSYAIQIRNTASNTLYAMGRSSVIVFNLLAQSWILNKGLFLACITSSVFIIAAFVAISIFFTPNNYKSEILGIRLIKTDKVA